MGLVTGGTDIGNMTANGGLAAASDGTTNQAGAACARRNTQNNAYVGKSSSSKVTKVTVFGANDNGYVAGANPSVTITLLVKQGVAPSSGTDGSNIGSITFTDTANESTGRDITSSDVTTVWDHRWIYVTHNGVNANMNVAEAQFYAPDDYTVAADVTSFTLTGIANAFQTARKVIADVAAFVFTGIAALFKVNVTLISSGASFAFTGVAAGTVWGRKVVADAGAFVLTGIAALFPMTRKVAADAGAFVLTGIAATTKSARYMIGAAASFVFTEQNALFPVARKVIADVVKFFYRASANEYIFSDGSSSLFGWAAQQFGGGGTATLVGGYDGALFNVNGAIDANINLSALAGETDRLPTVIVDVERLAPGGGWDGTCFVYIDGGGHFGKTFPDFTGRQTIIIDMTAATPGGGASPGYFGKTFSTLRLDFDGSGTGQFKVYSIKTGTHFNLLRAARQVAADVGAFIWTGIAANFRQAKKVFADGAAFVWTRIAANVIFRQLWVPSAKENETWTDRPKQNETWTPATKQSETWSQD